MAYRHTEIDQFFPVAGVDNDSQGFRDNFDAIKETLGTVESDINTLQTESFNITLTETDLNGNTVLGAHLKQPTFEFNQGGAVGSSQNISFLNGNYQVFTVNTNNVNFSLSDWPVSEKYGSIRVHLYGNGTALSITATSDSTDEITVSSTTSLSVDQPIIFTGAVFGGLTANTVYYVKTKTSSAITVSTSVGGSTVNLSSATGTATLYPARIPTFTVEGGGDIFYDNSWPAPLYVYTNTFATIVEFWTFNGGDQVYAKYLGTFSTR